MRALLHVAARTLAERRNVFAAAAVAALLPLLYSFLPWVGAENTAELRSASALVIAAGFSAAVALLFGATCLARDLRERRLSFYYSRPLPAASLWGGRMLAGWVLALAAFIIVLVPGLVTGPPPGAPGWPEVTLLAGVAAALLGCVAVGHAFAIMLASRSGWLALDLAALVVTGAAAAWLLGVVTGTGARLLIEGYARLLMLGAAAGVLGGGLAQTVVGRTDERAGHRALSLTLWCTLAGCLLLLAAYIVFLLNPTPRSVTAVNGVWTGSRGGAVVVSGPSRGRAWCSATFAIDTVTGNWLRLGRPHAATPLVALADDGSRVVWVERRGRRDTDPAHVMCLDLTPGSVSQRATTIVLGNWHGVDVALSPDGRLLAINENPLLTVFEVDSGRLVASVRLEDADRTALVFVNERRLRVAQRIDIRESTGKAFVVSALDLPDGRLQETGALRHGSGAFFVMAAGPGYRAVAVQRWYDQEAVLTLHDGWTLAPIADLRRRDVDFRRRGARWRGGDVAFLADGRVVVGSADRAGARLDLFTDTGIPAGTVALGPWRDLQIGGPVSPGRIAVSLSSTAHLYGWDQVWDECVSVDLETGSQHRLGGDVTSFSAPWWREAQPPDQEGSVAARLLLADRQVLLWDADGGRLRPLHGPSFPR